MKADSRSGFRYKRSENASSKVLGIHRKVDTKTLNKLFSDSWPTDYVQEYEKLFDDGLVVYVITNSSLKL